MDWNTPARHGIHPAIPAAVAGLGVLALAVSAVGPPAVVLDGLSVHGRAILWAFVAFSLIVPGGIGLTCFAWAHALRAEQARHNAAAALVAVASALLALTALGVVFHQAFTLLFEYVELPAWVHNPSGK